MGYYRSFWKNFSTVVAPLTDLLRAKTKYIWSLASQQAFANIKTFLCSPPVFVAPCTDQPFHLQVDASDVGAVALRFHYDDRGVEQPVSFYLKKFNRYQLNYSLKRKHVLVWALQHFEVYIDSGSVPLVVYTDHNPITFLHSLKCPNRRLMRWILFLQPTVRISTTSKGLQILWPMHYPEPPALNVVLYSYSVSSLLSPHLCRILLNASPGAGSC